MKLRSAFLILAVGLSVAGCNSMTPTQIANVTCLGAQTSATIAAAATADANIDRDATNRVAQAQKTAAAIQKTVGDICPAVVTGVDAINAAATGTSGHK
jgi:hypothetical protein